MTTPEIIILILLALTLIAICIAIVILLMRKPEKQDNMDLILKINEMMHISSKETTNDLIKFQDKLSESTNSFEKNIREAIYKSIKDETDNFMKFEDKILKNLDLKINQLDKKVSDSLSDGFKKTNETFQHIVERISKIDEAQKKIEQLSTNIVSLQDVLTDKKSRGTFGEVGLKQIFTSVFGENNTNLYEIQKQLSNNTMVDSVLHCPAPIGMLCIDSKFPLENYRRMVDRTLNDSDRADATKLFKSDVKKHIDDISSKYIIKGETAEQAVMFLPSEAIFAEINAYHSELVDYSYKKQVWITSPTTLMAFLSTMQVMLKNIERSKYTKIIQEELEKLSIEFTRYRGRWDKLKKDIDSVSKDVNDIYTTTDKITAKFERIASVDIKNEVEYKE